MSDLTLAPSAEKAEEWPVHATAIALGETGVLIRGDSGSGKSSLALALLSALPSEGFARLVGDDRLRLRIANGRLLAEPHPKIAGLAEQRGEGLLQMAFEPCVVIGCVIDLEGGGSRDLPPRFPDAEQRQTALGPALLPRLALPRGMSAMDSAWRVRAFVHRLSG